MLFNKKKTESRHVTDLELICNNMSFAAVESYKMLRTNLLFTLPDERRCRIIGITSAVSGEGKSTTAINLAYTFAETGKRVLLLEADMRRPRVAKALQLQATPGLSNLLAGMADGVIQQSKQQKNLYFIPAGDIPPNPSEMLGSARMRSCVQTLTERFDFLIIDLPPINIVTDAMSLSNLVDGFIFVVRQEYSTRQAVKDAMRQLTLVGSKVLGFVVTDGQTRGKSYRYRYGKYGRKYGYAGTYSYKDKQFRNVPLEEQNNAED